jgi:6-phosphofructokinase 1
MTKSKKRKGTIAILTGGGDVPGLNPAIRAVTVRALREGYRVLGLRRGWARLIELDRNQEPGDDIVIEFDENAVRNGRYDNVPIEVVTSRKKVVDVAKFYNRDRLRPFYNRFEGSPVFIMTSDY